jgi:hypothetical protein
VENGAGYSRTLLLSVSETQRSPLESNVRASGASTPVEVVTVLLFVKVFCPITRLAASWVENGAVYSRTLSLRRSATQRLPLESNARP